MHTKKLIHVKKITSKAYNALIAAGFLVVFS